MVVSTCGADSLVGGAAAETGKDNNQMQHEMGVKDAQGVH